LTHYLINNDMNEKLDPVRSLARDKVASPKDLGEATSNGMDLKSPIFKPNPGWGGKLKKGLTENTSTLFVVSWIALFVFFLFWRFF